jgi:hypothetical protein
MSADLFNYKPPEPRSPPRETAFSGPEYQPARDHARLSGQIKKVFDLMIDGRWRTLQGVADQIQEPPASVSAQLRHLRKPKWGAYTVERRHVAGGLFEYRVLKPEEQI